MVVAGAPKPPTGGKKPPTGGKKPAQKKKSDEDKAAEKQAKAAADLLKAAKAGDCAKVQVALAVGVDINHRNEKGQTAAHYAAAYGHKKVLLLAHANGADPVALEV